MLSASKIFIKRSLVSGVTPSVPQLEYGELAINLADKKIFFKDATNNISSIDQTPYTYLESLSSVRVVDGNNTVTGVYSSVLGGYNNDISGSGSTVTNGENNDIDGDFAFISNGLNNTIGVDGDYGAILGGQNNTLNHQESFILGSNITSHLSGFTYVNNLSSTNNIHTRSLSVDESFEAGVGASTALYVGSNKVGINTEDPSFDLTVNGMISSSNIIYAGDDIEITDPTKGIILRSPNNSRWRIVVSNTGTLSTIAL